MDTGHSALGWTLGYNWSLAGQSYFHDIYVDRCRTKSRVRTEMFKTYKDNFRAEYRTLARGEEDRSLV